MQPKTPKLLADVRAAAAFILQGTEGRTLADYQSDPMLRFAVERNFEIIGEAARRLTQHDSQTAARVGDCSQIIAFRNVLTHGYDLVDDVQVWAIIQQDLPRLHGQVCALLREAEGTS